jgi:hypothetical protein
MLSPLHLNPSRAAPPAVPDPMRPNPLVRQRCPFGSLRARPSFRPPPTRSRGYEKKSAWLAFADRTFWYIDVLVACRPVVEKVADNPGLFAALYGDDHSSLSFVCSLRSVAVSPWPCRKSNPDVLMVQTSEVWGGHDTANGLHSTRRRCILVQRKVRASIIVIFSVRSQQVAKMPLAEHNDMVKAIPSDRTDEPLRVSVLPWRSWCDRPVPNAHRANATDKDIAIDTIPILMSYATTSRRCSRAAKRGAGACRQIESGSHDACGSSPAGAGLAGSGLRTLPGNSLRTTT